MGINMFSHWLSSCDKCNGQCNVDESCNTPNPDPMKYDILSHTIHKNNVMVIIKYTGCTNFEGTKVLVYKNVNYNELKKSNYLDPHFTKDKYSPYARFVPTPEGINSAIKLLKTI